MIRTKMRSTGASEWNRNGYGTTHFLLLVELPSFLYFLFSIFCVLFQRE